MYHPVLVDMEQSNGVDLGSHHYHKSAATYIMKSISDTMHVTLLESLVKNDLRFSLIVDTTTSNMNVPYLICYFQLTEDGYPVTLYYRNIDLSDGETALATFNSFWDAVIKDDKLVPGFLQYFKTRLTFFVSDNASVMIGKNLSLLSFLKEKLGRNIVNIGCMAHKASLALKAAIRDTANSQLEFIKTFESNLNELYIFYMSRGSKRLQHLIDTALEFGVHLIRFRKNIEVKY